MTFPFPDMSLCDISLCLLSEFYYLIVSIQTCLYRWMEVRVMILVMMVNFFKKLIQSGAKLAEAYVGLYMDKAPPRTSQLSGMGWLLTAIISRFLPSTSRE